jgi:hypothetical protein
MDKPLRTEDSHVLATFEDAKTNGWDIEPVFRASKNSHDFKGTAAEVSARIADLASREAALAEQREHHRRQELHAPIDRLIRPSMRFAGNTCSSRTLLP